MRTRMIIAVAAFLGALVLVTSISFAAGAEAAPPASTPWWLILGVVALAFSEVVALVPQMKSNSVLTFLANLARSTFGGSKG